MQIYFALIFDNYTVVYTRYASNRLSCGKKPVAEILPQQQAYSIMKHFIRSLHASDTRVYTAAAECHLEHNDVSRGVRRNADFQSK